MIHILSKSETKTNFMIHILSKSETKVSNNRKQRIG